MPACRVGVRSKRLLLEIGDCSTSKAKKKRKTEKKKAERRKGCSSFLAVVVRCSAATIEMKNKVLLVGCCLSWRLSFLDDEKPKFSASRGKFA